MKASCPMYWILLYHDVLVVSIKCFGGITLVLQCCVKSGIIVVSEERKWRYGKDKGFNRSKVWKINCN